MRSLSLAAFAAFVVFHSVQAHAVDVVLSLSERIPISELAAQVTDPGSTRYGIFYSPEEIRALAAPSDEEYAKFLEGVRSEGLEIVSESKSHLSVRVRGERTQITNAFVAQSRFSLVKSMRGLEPPRKRHHHLRFSEVDARASKTSKQGGILPAQIKTAYGFDPIYKSGWTGKGQHIAVATYMGFHLEDVKAYYSKVGLSPQPVVDQVSFNGTPTYDDDSAAETQLDAEFTGMIAPGAAIHVFSSAENSDAGELAMFTAILDDNRAKIVNYSWGSCESNVDPSHKKEMDAIYDRAIAQGVNILVASGDSGSDGCGNGTTVADWPATSPSVIAVGGTTLKLTRTGERASEIGWGYINPNTGKEDGSGGGVSSLYALPPWQAQLSGGFRMRAFPDVAFNADPKTGEAIWTHLGAKSAHWFTIGGTSMAAPQWAGFLALVNEARMAKKSTSLNFLNPLLYQTSTDVRLNLFNDLTSGSNGAYKATSGWDAVTGLGSQQADALLNYLVGT